MNDELKSLNDVKIPYPTEGVIRTAQLDDTVSPANSVQLAVNMNFDRVGAIQTRPGVTSFADDLADAINNFGTLRNDILPPGHDLLFQLGTINDLVSNMRNPSAVKISDTKIVVFWYAVGTGGLMQNFSIDEITGITIPLGTPVSYDAGTTDNNRAVLVADNKVINVWRSASSDGKAIMVDCSADTPASIGTYTFESGDATEIALAFIDSTHVIVFYSNTSFDGIASVILYNSTSGAMSEPGSPLTFQSGGNFNNSCIAIDATHVVNFWFASGGNNAQTFSINLGTSNITALSTPFTFSGITNNCAFVDATHVFNVWEDSGIQSQVFAVNPSTFAITAVGTPFELAPFSGNDVAVAPFATNFDFLVGYSLNVGDGHVKMVSVDHSTYAVTGPVPALGGYDFANQDYLVGITLNDNEAMFVWGNVDNEKGRAVMFESFGSPVEGKWLYAGYDDKVANLPAGSTTWTDRRTGLATVSKPRFSQFLNYIWMVNGNQQIGGDPVATSNGGDFGTDLVPDDFPPGDFISAGFEGRVWVANRTLGVIYYTDIVQFNPPANYSLTFNPQVNFIAQLTPNTGQSITALQQVPRALLVFTEDTILRIYGASSVDAYPAYNVGTFSQESIITTKTGIFFHHSSGFYQFDYGGQPVEISRRIIDFVKAIPRANYDDIVGVYDGFDNVEWSVGQVVVEGVVFVGCVVRYTISTQVWTIYDYKGIDITAMIYYDDGINLNHLVGDTDGRTGQLDVGTTDYGDPFYYEFITRWISFTDLYYKTKDIDAVNVYHENASGANLLSQAQKTGPNAWEQLGSVTEDACSLIPNIGTNDFNVVRLRLVGTTKGPQIVVHGLEIPSITQKGQDTN